MNPQRTFSIPNKSEIKKRRAEVKASLNRHGLCAGPRLLKGSIEALDYLERVILCFQELGVVYIHFGCYLSSRYDWVPARDCRTLMEKNHPTRTLLDPYPYMLDLFGSETWEGFRELKELPETSELPLRRYYLLQPDIPCLNISFHDHAFRKSWLTDINTLDELEPVLKQIWPDFNFEVVCDEFKRDLQLETDLERQQEWLTEEAEISRHTTPDTFILPKLDETWSTTGLLATRTPAATPLWFVLQGMETYSSPVLETSRKQLARNLCLTWLNLALTGEWFPIHPNPGNLAILPNGSILFNGGATASLTPANQAKVLDYLMSTSANDADSSFSFMLGLLQEGGHLSEEKLHHRLRQVVPFRDGGWGRTDMAETLAEHLFVQWRVAGECGYVASESFRHFCRGLAGVAFISMKLAPDEDVLREALYEFRAKCGFKEFRGAASMDNLTEQAETFFQMMSELPRKFEATIERANRSAFQVRETPALPARANKTSLISLVLVLLSLVILSKHFAASPYAHWAEPLSGVFFLLFGGLLLRALVKG